MTYAYWRCPECHNCFEEPLPKGEVRCWNCRSSITPEPVAVLPVAELEALRALRARVEDEGLADRIGDAHEHKGYGGCSEGSSAVYAYRAALRGEG